MPAIYHWALASRIEQSVALADNPFITRSNFGPRLRAVRSLGDPGFHGTYGTMGNVKEWCANDDAGGKRFILGGGCGEPIYAPTILDSSTPLRRDETFGFRCVKFLNDTKGPAAAWDTAESIPWPVPPKRAELLDDATFRLVVRDRYAYDRAAPLDAAVEQADEGEWVHVTARINAAYRDAKGRWERFAVHLFLPKGVDARTGYQAVVYCPGGDGFMLPRVRPLAEEYGLDTLVRAGRAVVLPVYQGTYERRHAFEVDDDRVEEDRQICFCQDLMRSVDYLQQRGDIDMGRLGYYGFSFGATVGGSFLALEPRFRAAVFEAGGLSIYPLRKDRALLEWRHHLPQLRLPVLMLNGRADPVFAVEESQVPMFALLGSPVKEHYVHPDGHHMLPPGVKFEHTIRWFDRHLGVVARPPGTRGPRRPGRVTTAARRACRQEPQ